MKKFNQIIKITLTSLIAALACTGIIYAATTVGTNISTTGTLTATGLTTMGNASSTLFSVSNTGYIGGLNGLILADGLITDASGDISFSDENLTTTGTLNVTGLTTMGNASTTIFSVSNTGYIGGVNGLIFADGSITDASGDISFGDENLTTTGTVTANDANIYDALGNIDVGNSNFGALTTGYQNIALGAVNGVTVTTGFRNIGIGRVAIERVTTGSNNIGIGYSMIVADVGDANTAVGTHACGGIWGGSIWGDGDWSFNTCYGYEAGNGSTYNYHTFMKGEYNTFLGTRTGGVGQEGSTSLYKIDHSTLIGHGASIGANHFIPITAIVEEAGGGDVQITSTAHGLSDGDFITFRDVRPQGFLEQSSINSCALSASTYGLFKASSVTANTLEIDWCRSADGSTSNWNSSAVSPTLGGLAVALDMVSFNGDVSAHVDKAVIFRGTAGAFAGRLVSNIIANVPYWLCDQSPSGVSIGDNTSMTLRTRRGTCDGTATTEYVDIQSSDISDINQLEFAGPPYQCDSWVKADWSGSFTYGAQTQDFTSCFLDDTQGDGGKAFVAKVEINSEGGSDLNYDYTTVVGSNAVASCSNCVVLGRPDDTVTAAGTLTGKKKITIANATRVLTTQELEGGGSHSNCCN